ncbi:MAG: hypothetical protein ACM359_08175 [Bacillota bacterium]
MTHIATRTPPRRSISWKRLILMAVFVLVGLLLLIHSIWSTQANNLFEAQFDEYRRRGEPVSLAELKSPAVPDEQNAALDLHAAAAAIRLSEEQLKFFENLNFLYYPLPDEQFTQLRELLSANAEVVSKVQAARTKPAIDWKLTFDSPEAVFSLPDRTPLWNLARLLTAAALSAHHAGDEHTALQRIDDTLFLADAMAKHPTLVGYFTASGMESLSLQVLTIMAHDLQLDSPGDRQFVQQLITRLLDETGPRHHFVWALHSERAFQIEVIRLLASGRGEAIAKLLNNSKPPRTLYALASNVLRPLCLNNGTVVTRYTTQLAKAAAAPSWPAAKAGIPDLQKILNSYLRYPLASLLLPAPDLAVNRYYRHLTNRRMAAIALAIGLYAKDHNGNRPGSLKELVPAYLPAVPQDPFAPDGAPIRYLPGSANPRLYSVGENGVDDQGSELPYKGRTARYPWEQQDATYPLIPKPQPAEEAN